MNTELCLDRKMDVDFNLLDFLSNAETGRLKSKRLVPCAIFRQATWI